MGSEEDEGGGDQVDGADLRADLLARTRRLGLELRGVNCFVRGIVSGYTSEQIKEQCSASARER
jgi:hypothetical protein